jgi:hypothetical protein
MVRGFFASSGKLMLFDTSLTLTERQVEKSLTSSMKCAECQCTQLDCSFGCCYKITLLLPTLATIKQFDN